MIAYAGHHSTGTNNWNRNDITSTSVDTNYRDARVYKPPTEDEIKEQKRQAHPKFQPNPKGFKR